MNPRPLSARTCFLLMLLFGIAAYSNTFKVPFYFDDVPSIVENNSLHPPMNLEKIWQGYPPRFIANASFALQYVFTGEAPWGFHVINLLIHLLTAMVVFLITRMLLRTPALQGSVSPDQHDVFALAPALLFLTHPLQTQAVTYIVQRTTSLAALFYLATLWMYLKARLEDARHYRLVFFLMAVAMLTKEISLTLPFAILLTDLCFFPVSGEETIAKKFHRWIPFAVFLLIVPLIYLTSSVHLVRSGGVLDLLPSEDLKTSRWDYLLTQFRVVKTYTRLLFFPVNQCLDYDYRLSSGWGDRATWVSFSFLLAVLAAAFVLFKKHRLLAFGIFWFFLTLSVESSLLPIADVIFEHRLYLPMFGFAIFLAALLWQCARSATRFLALTLLIAVVLSAMTHARNEVWKNSFTLWTDTIKKAPHKGRPYAKLGEAYTKEKKNDEAALWYYHKTLETGDYTTLVLSNMAAAYFRLGKLKEGAYYQDWALASAAPQKRYSRDFLYYNQASALKKENKIPEAIEAMKKAVEANSQNHIFWINLGELYREAGQEKAAIASFRKAIEVAPMQEEGYKALALFYKEKGERQKALDVIVQYLTLKKKQGPLFGK